MRVVMLDADELRVLLERPLRRQVLGVQVVRDDLGLDLEHRQIELEIGAERAVRELGVEVAEMRREERLVAARDAERAFNSAPAATIGRSAATGSGSGPGA